jgi:putative tryptophan/tyrosine transport system substrate-binding protein
MATCSRRNFIGLVSGVAALWPLGTSGQQPKKLPRVGVLVGASPPFPFADAFQQGLHTLGYLEDRSIALEFRYTMGQSERATELAAELVRMGMDVIVTHWTQATRAAMEATKTVPIVMVVGAPLQSGFVDNLARPSGNATGLSGMDAELGGKRLQLLRDIMPSLACVAVLGTTPTTNPYSGPFVEDLRLAAAKVGLRLESVLVSGPDEFESAFAEMTRAGAQAVIVQEHYDSYRAILLKLAAKHSLAYLSGTRDTTVAGGLVSISANWLTLYERAAFYVDKIIKGAKPADLPVEQPTKFQTVLNLRTARSLGLTISPSLLAQIDEVIE